MAAKPLQNRKNNCNSNTRGSSSSSSKGRGSSSSNSSSSSSSRGQQWQEGAAAAAAAAAAGSSRSSRGQQQQGQQQHQGQQQQQGQQQPQGQQDSRFRSCKETTSLRWRASRKEAASAFCTHRTIIAPTSRRSFALSSVGARLASDSGGVCGSSSGGSSSVGGIYAGETRPRWRRPV